MMQNGHQLIDHIVKELFEPETRRLDKFIQAMIDKNQQAHSLRLDGMSYQGEFFNRTGLRGNLTRRSLHISLWPEMDSFLADRKNILADKQEINQLLFKLYDPCFQLEHIRDATPDCIVEFLPVNIRSMSRHGCITDTLKHPRDWRQFNKILPKIELYSATRLLY